MTMCLATGSNSLPVNWNKLFREPVQFSEPSQRSAGVRDSVTCCAISCLISGVIACGFDTNSVCPTGNGGRGYTLRFESNARALVNGMIPSKLFVPINGAAQDMLTVGNGGKTNLSA